MRPFKRRRHFGSLFHISVRLPTSLFVALEDTKPHGRRL